MHKNIFRFALLAIAVIMAVTACGPAPVVTLPAVLTNTPVPPPVVEPTATVPVAPQEFIFGMLLVGPKNDQGWSQATYEGGLYVEQKIPGSRMVYLENVYSGSPSYPGQTASQLAEQLVSQGATLIFFNSDDMKDEVLKFANAHPDIKVIGVSDDWTWKDGKNYTVSANQVDIMGRMEYMKMVAGCAAALTTQTGKIGFLGPLINDETRRLAASAYLGAKYCWTSVLGKDVSTLTFTVTWIGFWFNIPGVTSDPTQVADNFYNTGYDVVISGIDTTEALVEAEKAKAAGKNVWALAYDSKGNCGVAPDICLGVPYFNWGPAFAATVKTAVDGTWIEGFQWNGPDWTDINNPDTGAVGFAKGAGLSAENATKLDAFIAQLAAGLNLWTGPIDLQDGTTYLTAGTVATDLQIWYLPQLLDGMEGDSVAK
jgi:simple sugar transport system substrate-binding protein